MRPPIFSLVALEVKLIFKNFCKVFFFFFLQSSLTFGSLVPVSLKTTEKHANACFAVISIPSASYSMDANQFTPVFTGWSRFQN